MFQPDAHALPIHTIEDPMVRDDPWGTSFEAMLRGHEGDLRAFIAALVRDRGQREDIYQETARELWKSFAQFDGARQFGPWARGIARNMVRQHWKQSARQARLLSAEAEEAICNAWDPASGVETQARLEALQLCVEALPEDGREAVSLFYSSRMKAADIARQMGKSVEAVYQLLTRTRIRLAACVRRRLGELGEENEATLP